MYTIFTISIVQLFQMLFFRLIVSLAFPELLVWMIYLECFLTLFRDLVTLPVLRGWKKNFSFLRAMPTRYLFIFGIFLGYCDKVFIESKI